jgi:hypothetical protein
MGDKSRCLELFLPLSQTSRSEHGELHKVNTAPKTSLVTCPSDMS